MTTNNALRISIISGLFLVLLVPFYVSNHLFFPFITGKGFIFRTIIEIVLALWLILMLRDNNYRPKKSWILWALVGFVGIMTVADIFAENPYKAFWSNYERMEGLITLLHLLAYFVVSVSVLTVDLWKRFLQTSIFASVIMAFYGLLQLSGVAVINQGGVRLDGRLGNATYLAVYMLINVFLCLFLFVKSENKKTALWMYGPVFLLDTIILFYTATRGAILGFFVGLIVTAVLIALFEKNNKYLKKASIVTLAIIALIIGGFFLTKNTSFVKNNPILGRFASLSKQEIMGQGRFYIWPMAIKGFKERPILGWGQEGFSYVFNKNYVPQMYNQEPWFDRTHNTYLDWLIAGGILGFLGYVSLYAALLYYLWKKGSVFSVADKAVLTGLIAAYGFNNIFVFDNLISYILFVSLLAFVHVSSTKDNLFGKNWLQGITKNSDVVNMMYAPAIVIAVIFGIYFLNYKPLKANLSLIEAITPAQTDYVSGIPLVDKNLKAFEKTFSYNSFGSSEAREQIFLSLQMFSNPAISADIKTKFVALGKSEMERQLLQSPDDTRYLLFIGSFLNRVGDFSGAITFLEKALKTSPNKQTIMFELGTAYLSKGDNKSALEILKKAYELEPLFKEANIIYGIAAIYTHDDALAMKLFSSINQEDLVKDDRVVAAYSATKQHSKVVAILEARLKTDPNNPQYHVSLAAGYLDAGRRADSIKEIQTAMAINPNFKAQGEYFIKEINAGRHP